MAPISASATHRRPAGSIRHDAQAFRRLPLFVRHCLLACAVTLPLLLSACIGGKGPLAEWELSPEGERLYYQLVQLEAATSGDEKAFEESGQKLLELEPDEFTFLDMADFALRRRKIEEARIIARKGLEAFPQSLPLVLVISDSYLQQNNAKYAAETLASFVKHNPDNREAVQELARVYLMGEQYAELDKLIRALPEREMTPYMRYIRARSLLNRNRLAEGEQVLRRVVREDPDMVDAWVNLAMALQAQGKYTASFPFYRKAIDLDPDNLGLRLRLIDAELRSKRPDLAMKTVNSLPSPAFQMEAAMLFVEMRYFKAARTILTKVKNTPGAPEEAHLYLAAIAIEHFRNPADALVELSQISPNSPLAERALRWRLQLLEEAGRTHDAVPVAREFALRNPEVPAFQIVYAQVAAVAGDTETSIKVLRAARAKWPEEPEVAFYLASFLDTIKDKDEALQLMEFVIARQPKNALALNYIGYTLADEGRELDKALNLVERAVIEEPEDPHIMDSLAWVLYRQSRYDEAWKAITKSIGLGGDHPVIWEHYGDIAAKIGNMAEARKGYTNALKRDPENPHAIQAKMKELQ